MITHRIWQEPTPRFNIDESILSACDDDPLLAQIMLNRGFDDPEKIRAFLEPSAYTPAPPEMIPDLPAASALLRETIQAGRRVLIWGDFDVDGQTATALLVDSLRRLGADVQFYIPKRSSESHGIKLPSLIAQLETHRPGLLLTCDTGVAEFAALEHARAIGLPVIVTDHHDLGERLPPAQAVVNPKRLLQTQPDHPLITLPGVGVAYKLIQHLYTTLNRERDLPRLLDLVALGIVSDVATQVNDTRYLLQIGLERLRRTERIGLNALMEAARLAPDKLSAEQIGYQIGPRLNAVGRLDDASLAVELLTTSDKSRAYVIAQQMEGLNSQRREITRQIEDAAQEMIAQRPALLNYGVLVLHQPEWHIGLLGVVANRLAERYARPVVLLGGHEIASGSARSFGGIDIHAALAALANLLRTYGGHPGAAGLSLPAERIEALRTRLSEAVAAMQPDILEPPPLRLDAVVTLREHAPGLVYRLQRLAPFGEGNPPPVLVTKDLHLSHAGYIGRDSRHLKLSVEDDDGLMAQVLWWDGASQKIPEGRFDLAYTLTINDREELEATLVDFREHGIIEVQPEPELDYQDWRREADPMKRLQRVLEDNPEAQVWAEAFSRLDHPTWRRRAELGPGPTLIIYTIPSDPDCLAAALARVAPKTVHVFGVQPPVEGVEGLLRQLVLAVRNASERLGGVIALDVLCGATAASAAVVRAGLDFLAAEGQTAWSERQGIIYLAPPNGADRAAARRYLEKLRRAYEEMDAYRRFFRVMPLKRQLTPP